MQFWQSGFCINKDILAGGVYKRIYANGKNSYILGVFDGIDETERK